MKNLIIALILFCTLACNRQQATTGSVEPAPVNSTETPVNPEVPAIDHTAVQALYTSKCGRCHKAYEPQSRNAGQWDYWLNRMKSAAKLTEAETADIRAFLQANAKKG